MRVKADLSGMNELSDNFKKLSNKKTKDEFINKEIRILGGALMAKCIENTPVGQYDSHVEFDAYKGTDKQTHVSFDTTKGKTGGSLRRNWRVGTPESIEQGQKIEVENDLFYAGYVNDGHRIMRDGKMIGMYEGQHFLEKSVEQFEKQIPRLVEKDLEDYIEGVLDGKD